MNDRAKLTIDQAATIFASFTASTWIPLIVLMLFIGVAWRMLVLAQRSAGFNIQEMFLGENGRVSVWNVCVMFAFAMHSWYLMTVTLNKVVTSHDAMVFALIWCGSPVALELAKGWRDFVSRGPPPKD